MKYYTDSFYKTRPTGRLSNQLYECVLARLMALRDHCEFECTYNIDSKIFNPDLHVVQRPNIQLPSKIFIYPHDYKTYLKPNIENIRLLFDVEPVPEPYDLIIHLRLDDVLRFKGFHLLPRIYYENALLSLSKENIKRVAIMCYDTSGFEDHVKEIKDMVSLYYDTDVLEKRSVTEDFRDLCCCKYIISSCSTFCVLPALLNDNLVCKIIPDHRYKVCTINNVYKKSRPNYVHFRFYDP